MGDDFTESGEQGMGKAVEQLTGMMADDKRFSHSSAELRDLQVRAMNERFQERKDAIKLLQHRAREAGITEVRSLADIVPLLFPHTAYKSYPESFLTEGKWDRLCKWLATVSSYPISAIDTSTVNNLDDWLARLEEKGHFVNCSSGTSGKAAMFVATEKDMAWTKLDAVTMFSWSSGVKAMGDRRLMGLAPVAHIPKNLAVAGAFDDALGDPARPRYQLNVPPITIGDMTKMIVLRKKLADGTALPEEIAALESSGKEKQATLDRAFAEAAEKLVQCRGEKLMVMGMWSALYQIARLVRDMGYGGADFHPDNCLFVAGGLKGAQLPDDYQEFVHQTFNIPGKYKFQLYSMQEINTTMPKCSAGGRYHVPPWVVPLLLDESGEQLLPHESGEMEGRAAFFDLALDGRWGGVISGDRISLDLSPCACGNSSPSIRDNIARYADIKGDDKIACAGTVDAYVRGVS